MKRAITGLREPAVAGAFYPAPPGELVRIVDELLEAASTRPHSCPATKALIVPHAGYAYSGPIAASAFYSLAGRKEIDRVVLLGPSHYVGFHGLALPQTAGFDTPLGTVPIDCSAFSQLEQLPQVRIFDRAHQPEHCLEVELPFLQRSLAAPRIVPLLVGEVSDLEVAEVIELLWGGPETVVVVSSDLSHFLDYPRAQERDRRTADAIEELIPGHIGPEDACGSIGIRGLLIAANRRGLHASTLDLRNSGDTSGPRDRVVGYGAFAFS
jgi:MEMO1 family protein